MGCDIHVYIEKKVGDKYEHLGAVEVFDCRSYALFGFLAGVRNYSAVAPIAPERGIPEDVSTYVAKKYDSWGYNAHSASWLSVEELTSFDYGAMTEDRRTIKQTGANRWNGGCTCAPGEGQAMTYREFLGEWYFDEIKKLQDSDADRIVFWFDN